MVYYPANHKEDHTPMKYQTTIRNESSVLFRYK
ncbi:uncharacterized protein RAG0_00211 [Rhynchosporium agropyri]|uniref:Uncharacterized protein n=3 Tax=Rhynchosporium TaxID=38037 RepID=A0A1E1LZ44_RHYSE|nr:uncharacterized protein RAG0_00211 [Rhynchosporium agropyri]CZT13205.1 uncharacterized protein RCO7_15229 [Rhynchosporium commune]CZT42130.1 uncharacterized protein RSE6_01981 [Rhynchosporium secalis]